MSRGLLVERKPRNPFGEEVARNWPDVRRAKVGLKVQSCCPEDGRAHDFGVREAFAKVNEGQGLLNEGVATRVKKRYLKVGEGERCGQVQTKVYCQACRLTCEAHEPKGLR